MVAAIRPLSIGSYKTIVGRLVCLGQLHLMSRCDGWIELVAPPESPMAPILWLFMLGNTFQNLRVSSPAPVTIFEPHGLIER